ncbi:MAG: hypothetical protein A3H25_05715 [Sphingomonadales bacterium RIFCSPLOWO2_12_FULL_63_15]|nr:MAG: hypothetical protein A3H25_05715 [Sphingomonadales bacterium RIFCSPLOWO2_12_FULL_63_15]
MTKDTRDINERTDRVLQLEGELEAEGAATTQGEELDHARSMLHQWVDSVVAVVSSPGVGRVSLIHADGGESRISSPALPYLLSRPARFTDQG